MKGCPHGRLLLRACRDCGEVEGVVFPCESRFEDACPVCSRRWRQRTRARFVAGIREMRSPKFVTLTLRKPCTLEHLMDIWGMRKSFFSALKRRGYRIDSWCAAVELPNHIHLAVDCDYVPRHEMKGIWHGGDYGRLLRSGRPCSPWGSGWLCGGVPLPDDVPHEGEHLRESCPRA